MHKRILIAATIALLAIPLAAHAADGEKKKSPFVTADTDSDGKVSQAEYVTAMKGKLDDAAARTRFAELDKDRNGSLSREEFSTSTGEKKARKKKEST
jgi:Ca2+-binding EF-hand superfamily protein